MIRTLLWITEIGSLKGRDIMNRTVGEIYIRTERLAEYNGSPNTSVQAKEMVPFITVMALRG